MNTNTNENMKTKVTRTEVTNIQLKTHLFQAMPLTELYSSQCPAFGQYNLSFQNQPEMPKPHEKVSSVNAQHIIEKKN
jgi:hypothetical protein